jgi:Protein of unknown function (DUF3253)
MTQSDSQAINATLIGMAREFGHEKSFCPSEAARRIAGDHPDQWGPMMQPIRKSAVLLAQAGRLIILRKGKPVDPLDFKGVYRLTLPRED